jgi:phosphatidylserine decarboxylase
VFAPGSGRYLFLGGAVLLLLSAVVAARVLPVGVLSVALLTAGGALLLFFVVFFRDPERPIGEGIVAPADGRIREVAVEGGRLRISTFMNVTDVHVNRLPIDAGVVDIADTGAGYRPAYSVEATHNVQRAYRLTTALGPVELVQMTGVLARRLVSMIAVGDQRPKGSRFGMILLGSRVDLSLPADRVDAVARVGDRVRAGVTTVARERR